MDHIVAFDRVSPALTANGYTGGSRAIPVPLSQPFLDTALEDG